MPNWALFALLVLTTLGRLVAAAVDYETEVNLTQKLLTGYNKQYRPPNTVSIGLTFFINQIVAIDDSSQQMRSSITIMAEWDDSRLNWDNLTYDVDWMLIRSDSLWQPDLVILNSVSTSIFLSLDSKNLAYVSEGGRVAVLYSVPTLTTRCLTDVAKFPMDRQTCAIIVSSWSMCETYYSLDIYDYVTEFYTENGVWYLDSEKISNTKQNARDRYTYENEECIMEVVTLNLPLTRRPLYYMINMIFPSFILTVITLVCFALPAPSQFAISLTIFLNYSVSSVRVASLMPIQSTNMPVVIWYLFGSMMMTLVSFLWFVLDFTLRANSYLPRWLTTLCLKVRGWARTLIDKWKAFECKRNKNKQVKPVESLNSVESDLKKQPSTEQPTSDDQTVNEDNEKKAISEQQQQQQRPATAAAVPVDTSCVKCESCAKCQEKEAEKKAGDKKKTEFDKNMLCLNRIVFSLVLATIFVFNLACWSFIGSG